MRVSILIAAALCIAAMATPRDAAFAQTHDQPKAILLDPTAQVRVDGLVDIVGGAGDYDSYFSTGFRAQVPQAKFDPIVQQLIASLGKPTAIEAIDAYSPWEANLKLGFERGIANAKISVDPAAPHPVTGLLITGTEARDDSLAKLDADFGKLAGESGYGIYALDGGVRETHAVRGDIAAPLGSAFKLWVLAELSRQVQAGTRHWSEVVTLPDDRSLPSGMIQNWPKAAPVTLQTLATLMISISDNSATDTLIQTLGRERIEAMVATTGTTDPDRNQPFLTTRELFRLKAIASDPLLANWTSASAADRRAILDTLGGRKIDIGPALFANGPVAQQFEWFASPQDEARLLDWLRQHGDATTHAIMAINPGTPLQDRFAYIGFKGGSEPGVITLNYLVRTKAKKWYAVTGNWHRSDADVEALAFSGLMNRALAMVPQE